MRRSWRWIVPPDSAFHSQTFFNKCFTADITAVDFLLGKLALNDHLRGYARMILSGLPQRVARPPSGDSGSAGPAA